MQKQHFLRRPFLGMSRLATVLSMAILTACGGGGSDSGALPPQGSLFSPSMNNELKTVVTFTATDADFPNPERGFYRWTWTDLDTLTRDDADDAYKNGYRLLFSKLNLSAYRNAELPSTLLAQVETALANSRAAGTKLVMRVVYNYPETEVDYRNAQDAPLSRVLAHIEQLKPVLQRNADIIAKPATPIRMRMSRPTRSALLALSAAGSSSCAS